MKKQTKEPKYADYGTDERSHHGEVKPELTGRGYAIRMRAVDNCELDRLLYASEITPDEWSAGDSLAKTLHAAKMMGMAISKPERLGGGGHVSQRQALALLKVTDATRWLDLSCGEEIRKLVIGVCLSEVRVETKDGVSRLRLGLSALVNLGDDRRMRLALLDELVA